MSNVIDRFLLPAVVEEIENVTPRMRRIRLAGDALRVLDWLPGQHVRVRVGNLLSLRGFRDSLRTYSVWDYDPRGRLDLCVLEHPEAGPGVRWAREAVPGATTAVMRPEGRLIVRRDAPYHLFAGDETASVAFGAMLRGLGGPVRGAVLTSGDRLPLPRAGELAWPLRDGGTDADALVRAVRELDLPGAPGAAYVAGEARACQAVRAHLVRERGWPRDAIRLKAFWAPGKRGLD
ncbi:siderophore-interacting protein [Nonomuraea sp. SBT364]|uniref:siderophore-interacting protein n=1 Tax=Nonomuraea sp. SBT364 TaxID=1580530 RepID=UPI0018CE2531|nr:siderophore-interacting protein [Nonomuraea sp. SBT364]